MALKESKHASRGRLGVQTRKNEKNSHLPNRKKSINLDMGAFNSR